MMIFDRLYFKGSKSIFSNMYPCEIHYKGKTFKNLESAYHFAKMPERFRNTHRVFPLLIADGYRAKEYGATVPIRKDWDEVKDSIMLELLRIKFSIPELKSVLVNEDRELVHESYDKHWGNGVDNRGENKLGELLMKVRDELNEQQRK